MVKYKTDASHAGKQIAAVAVSSDLDGPCTPCGICRQVLREFCSLDTPIFLPGCGYSMDTGDARPVHATVGGRASSGTASTPVNGPDLTVVTLEELLPMSFGPEQLSSSKA